MRFHIQFLTGILLASSLIACGGGGGGGGGGAQTVTLGGIAAKGILKGADVTAYEVINGQETKVSSTTTDAEGSYSLDLPATNNTVIVAVTVNDNTTMLDESQLVNGVYKEVKAPAGLALRTAVEDASSDRTSVNANPFTEMAVTAAKSTGSFTKANLLAARAMVKQFIGMDPELALPIAPDATATADQRKMMTLLTGLAGEPDVAKAVKELAESLKVEIQQNGTLAESSVSELGMKLNTLKRSGATKLTDLGLDGFKDDNTDYDSIEITAVDPVLEAERASLKGFVTAIKDGLNKTETTSRTLIDSYEKRIVDLTFVQASSALDLTLSLLDGIDTSLDGNNLVVTKTDPNSSLTVAGSNGTYTVSTAKNKISISGSKTATGARMTIQGKALDNSGVSMKVDLEIAGINTADGSILGDGVTATLKELSFSGPSDQDPSKTVGLKIENGELYVSKNESNVKLSKGTLTVNSSMSDSLTGQLVELSWDRDPNALDSSDSDVPRRIALDITGTLDGTQLLNVGVDVNNKTAFSDYHVAPEKRDLSATFKLTLLNNNPNKTTLTFTATENPTDGLTETMVLTTGVSSVTFKSKTDGGYTITSATTKYTATLDKNRNGEVKAGATKVGDIKNGVLYYDGIEVSLF